MEFFKPFLPDGLLDIFDIKSIDQHPDSFSIHLEEKNNLPPEFDSSDYESKGFYKVKKIQDFPIRGKAVYLHIKRRRWRRKDNGDAIHRDFTIKAAGTQLTQELADFLKYASQLTRRHYK
jgi:transposase